MQLKLLQTYPLRQENADVSRGFRNTFLVILVVSIVTSQITIVSLFYVLHIFINSIIYTKKIKIMRFNF